jgi:hypothetical protein
MTIKAVILEICCIIGFTMTLYNHLFYSHNLYSSVAWFVSILAVTTGYLFGKTTGYLFVNGTNKNRQEMKEDIIWMMVLIPIWCYHFIILLGVICEFFISESKFMCSSQSLYSTCFAKGFISMASLYVALVFSFLAKEIYTWANKKVDEICDQREN